MAKIINDQAPSILPGNSTTLKAFTCPDEPQEKLLRTFIDQKTGEPWFVGQDVVTRLGISNTSRALAGLDADEKGIHIVNTLGGDQEMTIINESGLYSLIMKSRKPEAKKFQKWVTSVVLPSIRKHGGYIKGQEALPEELVSILHQHIQDNALPALRYYDRLTEHDHYPSISLSKRKASSEYAVVKTAQEFNLPIEFVQALRSYGLGALER